MTVYLYELFLYLGAWEDDTVTDVGIQIEIQKGQDTYRYQLTPLW